MLRQGLPLVLLSVAVAGCMQMNNGSDRFGDPAETGTCQGNFGRTAGPTRVPGALQDGWNNNVAINPMWPDQRRPGNSYIASEMIKNSIDAKDVDVVDSQMMLAGSNIYKPGGFDLPFRPLPGGVGLTPKGVPLFPGMPPGAMLAGYGMRPGATWGQSGTYPYSYPYSGNFGSNPTYLAGGNYPSSPAGGGGITLADFRAGSSTDQLRLAQYQPGPSPYYPNPGGFAPPYPAMQGWNMGAGSCPPGGGGCAQRTQIYFALSERQNRPPIIMKIHWVVMGPDCKPILSQYPMETPFKYNFVQGAIYRLKLTNITGHEDLELYPTMEVMPGNSKTVDFLSHSAVPVAFTEYDFKQVLEGNYVVKVIYLPDPQYQDQAGSGLGEILSTRLDPGLDPVREAQRRGTVLVVIRMGNVQQNLGDNSPPLNAPAGGGNAACMPGGCPPGCPPGMMGGAGACPPGYPPGCPPGMMGGGMQGLPIVPPSGTGLGGPSYGGLPPFLNQRPLPQVPYMQWYYAPYANGPWTGTGRGPYGQFQYQPGACWGPQCPPGMSCPPPNCPPGRYPYPGPGYYPQPPGVMQPSMMQPGIQPGMQPGAPNVAPAQPNQPGAKPDRSLGNPPNPLPPEIGGGKASATDKVFDLPNIDGKTGSPTNAPANTSSNSSPVGNGIQGPPSIPAGPPPAPTGPPSTPTGPPPAPAGSPQVPQTPTSLGTGEQIKIGPPPSGGADKPGPTTPEASGPAISPTTPVPAAPPVLPPGTETSPPPAPTPASPGNVPKEPAVQPTTPSTPSVALPADPDLSNVAPPAGPAFPDKAAPPSSILDKPGTTAENPATKVPGNNANVPIPPPPADSGPPIAPPPAAPGNGTTSTPIDPVPMPPAPPPAPVTDTPTPPPSPTPSSPPAPSAPPVVNPAPAPAIVSPPSS